MNLETEQNECQTGSITFTPTWQIWCAAKKLAQRQRRTWPLVISAVLFVAILLRQVITYDLSHFAFSDLAVRALVLLLVILSCGWLGREVEFRMYYPWLARRMFRRDAALSVPMTWKFSESGLRLTRASDEALHKAEYKWSYFSKRLENNHVVVLQRDGGYWICFPKAAFRDDGSNSLIAHLQRIPLA